LSFYNVKILFLCYFWYEYISIQKNFWNFYYRMNWTILLIQGAIKRVKESNGEW